MSTFLENGARIYYNNKMVKTCTITTQVNYNILSVHKRAVTDNLDIIDSRPVSRFKKDEIITFEIQIINYSSFPATGKNIFTDESGKNVRAIKIVDNIDKALRLIQNSVVLLQNEKAIRIERIRSFNEYNNGEYRYILDSNNKMAVLIPEVLANDDVVITFNVQSDGTIPLREVILNNAEVYYKESPNHEPEESEDVMLINSFSDLSITKSGPESVNCNEEFTYRIIVKNSGDLPESGLSIVDMLPNNFKIADKGIVVMRNSKILSENIDYKLTISCDEITIGGTNDKPLEIGGNQVITVDITGLVRCIR